MGWVLPNSNGKTLGCEHNLHRRIEYRFTAKDRFSYLPDAKERVAQAGDEIIFHCPFGCPEVAVLVTHRQESLE